MVDPVKAGLAGKVSGQRQKNIDTSMYSLLEELSFVGL